MLGYVGILLFIRLLSLLLKDGGLSMEFKIEPSKSILYNSNLFSTVRKIYVFKSIQLTKLHSHLPPHQMNHLREEHFASTRPVAVIWHPFQTPNPTSGIAVFYYMIHEYWSVWVPMVGMFHSALICCSSRIPLTCLLLWSMSSTLVSTTPTRPRLHMPLSPVTKRVLFRSSSAPFTPHWLSLPKLQIWFFHKLCNRFHMFCDKFCAQHMLLSFWSLSINSVVGNNLASSFSNYLFRKTTHLIYFHSPIFIY